MEITQITAKKHGPKLLEIDNLAFSEKHDFPSSNLEEHLSYLNNCTLYGILKKEELVAYFAILELDNAWVELRTIAVLPEFQNNGIGTLMLKKFFQLTDCKNIRLVTHPHNKKALHLYLKHGFTIIGLKNNYFGDGEPRLLLHKTNEISLS